MKKWAKWLPNAAASAGAMMGMITTSSSKKIPQRTCVACREQHPKREMVRLVLTSEQRIRVDPSGKQAGRGAYLCGKAACWNKAAETDVIGAALRVTLSEADRQHIRDNVRS
jgi:hypothetical protein